MLFRKKSKGGSFYQNTAYRVGVMGVAADAGELVAEEIEHMAAGIFGGKARLKRPKARFSQEVFVAVARAVVESCREGGESGFVGAAFIANPVVRRAQGLGPMLLQSFILHPSGQNPTFRADALDASRDTCSPRVKSFLPGVQHPEDVHHLLQTETGRLVDVSGEDRSSVAIMLGT